MRAQGVADRVGEWGMNEMGKGGGEGNLLLAGEKVKGWMKYCCCWGWREDGWMDGWMERGGRMERMKSDKKEM